MKRRVEYMAGRYCATEAVRSILPRFDSDIATGSGGVPCWPTGLVGSITHTHEFASAAVASTSRARGIGIDTERVLTPSALRAVRRIGTRADDPAPSSLGLADEIYYALLFSSKESVFKCLPPLVRRMFDFQDVRIAFARELGTFRVTLLADLSCDLPIGFTIDGRWVVAEPLAHTGVVLQPL
jgi:enterobactin synthetase component D